MRGISVRSKDGQDGSGGQAICALYDIGELTNQALAGDGSTVVDVVQAARELKARGLANCGPLLECKALFEAVDKMDGKEKADG